MNLEGLPRTEWHTVKERFELTAEEAAKNVWNGELYLAWHRGTYSNQRKTKTLIRALEQSLHDAELVLSACSPETKAAARHTIREAWEKLMLHQFHDIAAGCGLRDVHREAEDTLSACVDRVDELLRQYAGEAYGV